MNAIQSTTAGGRVPAKVIPAAVCVVMLWASAFVAVRIAVREIAPIPLAFSRYVVATLVFVVVAIVRRPRVPMPSELFRLAVAGLVGIAGYNVALNSGQRFVTAGLASLLVNTVPVWTSLLSAAFLHERIGLRGWSGTFVAFLGAAIIGLHRGG